MKKFGLIGFPLAHSFSKKYYDAKIERQQISGVGYDLYPIPDITDFPRLVEKDTQLMGINVTIPYKIAVMDYLDQLSPEAKAISAVNCIRIDRKDSDKPLLTGYNTDVYGFTESLKPLLQSHHHAALILGNGGAAKAVSFALGRLGIPHTIVSRSARKGQLTYAQLDAAVIGIHPLIINSTPLGTYPDVMNCPNIPYGLLDDRHLLYDLVYNPPETEFLKRGKARGAVAKNGLEMLELQAERNWEIWNAGG